MELKQVRKIAGYYTCAFCEDYTHEVEPCPNTIDAQGRLLLCNRCKSTQAVFETTLAVTGQSPITQIHVLYLGRPETFADNSHTDTCRTGEHGDPPFSRGQIVKANDVPIYPEGGGGNWEAVFDEGPLVVEEVVHHHQGSYWVMRLRSLAINECFYNRFYPCEHFSLES